MRTIHRTIVSALVISNDGKLLIGQKFPHRQTYDVDCWHIPGGGVDEGESLIQALHREMLEEVGIDISDQKVELADDKGIGEGIKVLKDTGEKVWCKMQFNVFRIDLDKDAADVRVIPGDDMKKLIWADPSKLDNYKMTPPSIELFKRINLVF
jgi:8-oxo-dGTP pyrophosphatase MutT (NUDIX family)